ncbi:Tetratricopeptide repeat protein 16 [Cichlidogyrus casuarinus]|uniref:Tetratricopeptide repeat protein 16 n=1 Tax=Cichlidogyrus casuarinus TaxID=1844966 RepID=A0ABD2PZH7_9PLAT
MSSLNQSSHEYEERGDFAVKENKNFDALNQYSKAILFNPTRAQLYVKRGAANRLVNNFAQGFDDFAFAFELLSESPDAQLILHSRNQLILTLNGYALELNNARRYSEAIDLFTHIIAFDPDQGKYFVNRGDAFYQNGEFNSAMLDFEQAFCIFDALKKQGELNEEDYSLAMNVEARLCLAYCALSRQHSTHNRYGDALTNNDSALKLRHDCWHFWAERAKLNYKFRQFATAKQDILQAINLASSNGQPDWELNLESYLGAVFTTLFPKLWARDLVTKQQSDGQKQSRKISKRSQNSINRNTSKSVLALSEQIRIYRALNTRNLPKL